MEIAQVGRILDRTRASQLSTRGHAMILHVLIAMVAGWVQRHQQQVISYLSEENRILKAQLGSRRLRLTDTERRRLAALAHPLGRQRLKAVATLATPDTLMRWYKRLVAQKFDGSKKRRPLGRPRVAEEVEQLVMRMAEENPTWGYRRLQGHTHEAKHSPPLQRPWIQIVASSSRAGFARLCVSFLPPWLLTVRHWHKPVGESGAGPARTQRSPSSSCRLRPGNVAPASGDSVLAVSSPTRQSAPVDRG